MTDFSFDDFLETQEGEKSETTAQSDGGFSFDNFLNGAKSDSPSEKKDNPLPVEPVSSTVQMTSDVKPAPEEAAMTQKRGITMSADEMNVPQSTILSKDEAEKMGEMNANEVAARSYEQATGVDAPDNKILAHIANMGTNVGGRLNANLQMQAAQQLLSKSGNRSDDETRGLFSKMILGATKYLGGRLFVDDALDEWDKTEGETYKTPEERTRARNAFVDELARQFIAERTATKHNATMELENRDQGFWATVLGEGPAQVGNSLPYMLGPVGIALQFAQQSAATGTGYANDEYGFAKDGSLGVVAEGDSAGKAAVKGVASGAFETGSEIIGGKIAGAVGKRLGKVLSKGGKVLVGKYPVIAEKAGKMAETKVGTAVSKFGTGMKNLFAWTSKKLHLENPIEENIEEWETENLNALFGTGARDSEYVNNDTGAPLDTWDRLKKANAKFFKPENLIKMNEAMLLTMGGGAFVSHMAQRGMKKEVDSFLREHKLMTDKEIASTDLQTKAQALDAWSKGLSEEEVLKKINSATSLVDKLADKIAAEPSQAQKTVTLKRHLSEMNDFNSLIERAGEIDKATREQGGTTKRFTVQQDENGKPKFDTTIGVDPVTDDNVERKEMFDADSGVTVIDANGTYVVKSVVTGEKFKTSNFNRAINAADAMAVLNQQRVEDRQTKRLVLENLLQNEAYANRKIEVFETADQARRAIGGDFENDSPGFTTVDGTTVLILDNLDNPATALAALDKGTENDRGAFADGVNFETVAEKDDDGEVVETRVARDNVHDVTIIENPDGKGFTVFGKDVPYTNVATVEEATALARGEKIEIPNKEEATNETRTDEAPAQPEQAQSVKPSEGEETRPVEAGEAPTEVGGEVEEEAYVPSTERDSKIIQGTDYTVADAKRILREDVDAKIADAINELGVDIKVKGIELHGSRVRGDAKDDSDLDLVVEYSGDVKEDVLFEILNENPTDFNGIKVDINPINAEKTGSLKEYMARSEQYDAEKSVEAPTSASTETQANTPPTTTESAERNFDVADVEVDNADKKTARVDEKATENAYSAAQQPETKPATLEVGEAKSIKKRLEKKRNKGFALTDEETALLGRAEEAIKADVKAKRDASRAATLEKAEAVQPPSWMGKNAGPTETRMADLSGYLADKGHNRASLHRAIQSVRDYVKKHGALALSKNDKANLADALAKATERLAKMKENDQAAFAERNADMPTSQLEEYLVGKPNKLLSYWVEHGALLSRPRSAVAAKKAAGGKGVFRDAKFDGKLFDPDSVGADELNHFFDGMNERERNKWLKLLFGKDTKEVSDQTVTGNDATLEELGLSMGEALSAFREAYGDFQEWRANGAESGEEAYYRNLYEEEQAALDEEFGPVAEYALDELAAREAADKEYANAMAYVENKATAKDVAVLKPSNLSAAEEGDEIRVDHHKKTFDFLGYDAENGILYLEDRVEVETDEGSYLAPETRYYRVSEDAISEIIKEQANGFRNETGASDNRAVDEKGASRGGSREENGKAGATEKGSNNRLSDRGGSRQNANGGRGSSSDADAVRSSSESAAGGFRDGERENNRKKREAYNRVANALDPAWRAEHPDEVAKLEAEGIDVSAVASNPAIKGTDEISWPITATRVGSREDAANIFRLLSDPGKEITKVLYLDDDGNILDQRVVAVGLVGSTPANIEAVLANVPEGTYGIVFSHNHPAQQGNSVRSSADDVEITRRLKAAVEENGLKLLDHIITDHNAYESLSNRDASLVSDDAGAFWDKAKILSDFFEENVEKPEDMMNLVPYDERIDMTKDVRGKLNALAALASKVYDKSSWVVGVDDDGKMVFVASLPKSGDIESFLAAHPGAKRFAVLNGENAVDLPSFINAIEQEWKNKAGGDERIRPLVVAVGENGALADFAEEGLNDKYRGTSAAKPSAPRLANAPKLDDETTKEITDILGDIGGLLRSTVMPISSSRVTSAEDAAYLDAVKRGDMETAQRMVDEAIEKSGYSTPHYFDIHSAPSPAYVEGGRENFRNLEELRRVSEEDGGDLNLFAIANGISPVPDDYFTPKGLHLYMQTTYGRAATESLQTLAPAIDEIRRQMEEFGEVRDMPKVVVYRAVPDSVKEGSLQSEGQWVSPSKTYAIEHGKSRFGDGKYRIIEQAVGADELWFDGNAITEWGFDDGLGGVYQNTWNNRKLADPVTYDDNGNVIPLSQRFNPNNDSILYSPVEPLSLTDEEEDKFFSGVRRMAKALKAKGYDTFEDMIRTVASMRPDIYERGKDLFRRAWNFYDVETDGITIARGAEIFDALDQELGTAETAPEPFTAIPTFDSDSESSVDAALRKTRGILSVMDRDFPIQDVAPETGRLASSVAELEASGGVVALAQNPERFKATLVYNLLRSSVKPLESEKAAGKLNERPYIERAANGDAEAFVELYNYFMAENAYKGGTKGFIRSALIGAGLFDLNNEEEIKRIASIVWYGTATEKKGDRTFVYEENRDGIYIDFLKGNVDIYTTGNEEYREEHPDGKGVWSLIPAMKNKIRFIVRDIKRRYNPTIKGKNQEGEEGENKPGRGERLILNAKNDEGQELIDSIADRPFDEILTNYVDDKPATSKNPNVQKNVDPNRYEYAEGRRLSKLEQDRLNAMEVVDRLIAKLKPEYSDLIRAILNAERSRGDDGFVKFNKMGGTPFVDKKSLDVARKELGLESRRFAFRIKQLFNYINHDMTRDVEKLKNRLSQINEPNKFEDDDGLDVTVQAQVIDLLKEGEAVSDIAKALKISEASVRMYKTRALRAGENLPFDNALGLGDVPLNKPVEKSSELMRLEKTESARRKSLSKSASARLWTPNLFESSGKAQSTASEEMRRKIVEGIASGLTDEEIAKDANTSPEIVRVERIRQSTPGEAPTMVKGKPLSEQVRYVTERNIFNNETGHFERHRVQVMMDGSEVVFALNGEPVSSIAGNELSQVERNDLFDLPAQNGGETRNLFADLPKKPSQDMLLSPVMPLEDKEINENSNRFDDDLQRQIDGKLPKDYIYQLGRPGVVLRSTGVPDLPIQLSATRLTEKSKYKRHPFDIGDVRGLVKALQSPVAVFYYGNKEKAQNIIVEISRNGKNFLVGLSLNPEVNGRALDINSIRSVFPKDTAEWLHWIEEGKLLYADKNKIQALIDQQRMTLADVEYLNLDSVDSILKDFVNPQVESSAEKLNSPVAPLDNMRLAAVEDMVQSLVEPMKKNGYDSFGDLTRVIAAKDIALFSKVRPYLRDAWNRATGQNVALTTAENIFRDYEARLAALRPVRSRGIDGRTIDTTGEKTEANPLGRALVPEDGSMQQIIDKQIAASQKTQNTPPPPAPGSVGNEKLKHDYEPEAFGSGIDDNPIAREEIIDKFRELFPDVAIRGRGTRPLGKNTAGHFEPGAGIIRSKNPVSLRTIPHEIGHYIDAAYKSMGLKRPTSVQLELYRLGKNLYGNKVPNGGYESEGFAELLKFYMQGNTEGLKKEAPAAYNWLMNDFATRKPDVMARVDAIRDLIDRFQNQSGIQAVRAMTVPDPSFGRKLVNTLVDIVNAVKPTQENWIDKGAFISKAMKASGINKLFDWREAMKKKDYAEMNRIIENHPVLKWKLYNGKAGMRAFKALEDGLTDLSGTRRYTYGDLGVVTPGHAADEVLPTFKEIFKDFTPKELDDFKTEYAVARVAKELYLDKGLQFGLTEKEIAPVLKKYANNTKFKEALDLYTHYKHGVLHLLVDAGAMSQEQFEAIVSNNPIYVKISRHMDSLDAFKKAMMRRNGKAVNERKGGSQRIEDIFDAGLVDDERVFRAAFQADLFRSIINAGKLAEQNGGTEAGFSVGANWIHEVPNAQGAVTFSSEKLRKQIVDALKKSGAEGANGETGDTLFDALFGNGENLTIFKEKPSNGKKGIVSIYGEDGRLHTYELPDNNAEGWAKGLLDFTDGNTFASLWEKWGEFAVSAVRAGATQLNPVFALRNLLRDTLNAATYNQYGTFIPVVSSIEGVVKDLMDKKPAQMYKSMGLEMGGFMGRSRLAGARKSNNYLLSKNWAQAQLRKGFFKAIADVVGVTENGTRIKNFENAYDYMLKNGASDKAAQMIAGCWSLDATVDFLRSGTIGQKINKFIPFFNAGVQGIDQFLRGFGLQDPKAWDLPGSKKERAARTVMQGVSWLTTLSILGWIVSNALRDEDDPEDEELPPHERWNYISFGNFRMPIPYEAGYIFASIPKAVLETVVKGDANALPECLKMFGTSFPLQAGSLHELMRNNALFAPLIDVAFNEDWKGSQIVPSYVRDSKESWEWYTRRTTGLSKDLGKALHKIIGNSYFSAPAYIDTMFDGWTGGLYSKLAKLAYGESELGFDTTRPSDWPVVGTLFRSPTATRVAGNFYDELKELERKVGSGTATVEEAGRKVLLDETAKKIRPLWDENGKLMNPNNGLSRKYRFDKMDENNLKARREIKAIPTDAATLRKEGIRKLAMSASNPASSEHLVENSLKMLKAGGVTLQEAKDAILRYAEETGKIKGATIGRHWLILEAVWNGEEIPDGLKRKKRQ